MADVSDHSLRAVRDLLLIMYSEGLLDDEEFLVLYDMNFSREIYPYWDFTKFDLTDWDDTRCKTELRFAKKDLPELLHVLAIPEKICTKQRTTCSGMEGLCILLRRLAYPCRIIQSPSIPEQVVL